VSLLNGGACADVVLIISSEGFSIKQNDLVFLNSFYVHVALTDCLKKMTLPGAVHTSDHGERGQIDRVERGNR
jgi:hypothetical protein